MRNSCRQHRVSEHAHMQASTRGWTHNQAVTTGPKGLKFPSPMAIRNYQGFMNQSLILCKTKYNTDYNYWGTFSLPPLFEPGQNGCPVSTLKLFISQWSASLRLFSSLISVCCWTTSLQEWRFTTVSRQEKQRHSRSYHCARVRACVRFQASWQYQFPRPEDTYPAHTPIHTYIVTRLPLQLVGSMSGLHIDTLMFIFVLQPHMVCFTQPKK